MLYGHSEILLTISSQLLILLFALMFISRDEWFLICKNALWCNVVTVELCLSKP